MKRTLLGILLIVLACSSANAATIWKESINGDLAGSYGVSPPDVTMLTASLGANTVVGSMFTQNYTNCIPQPPDGDCIFLQQGYSDIDGLWLDIPDGARITDISFTLTSPPFPESSGPTTSRIRFDLRLLSALPLGFGGLYFLQPI
jgi:hypothetical protein